MANACNDEKHFKRRMAASIWRARTTLGFTCLRYTSSIMRLSAWVLPAELLHQKPCFTDAETKPLWCCFCSIFYTKAFTKTTTALVFIYWCSCKLLGSCLEASISVSGEWLSKTQKLCDLQGTGRWHSFSYLYLVWGVISSVTLLSNHSNQYPDPLVQTQGYGF